ncbi:Nucleoporin nup85 [Mortierella polycephala]|uniref:Nuclear pore complex protein Nup85 n=1 Tax=Mortierella polycephala TaxID=41804 RepID=A0A9P6U2W1_9FUNG|nr:Nucleoporin nup85 [Mortierella polycephala]
MSGIPLIQPSKSSSAFGTNTATLKRSIFSDPTEDRIDSNSEQEQEQDNDHSDDGYVSVLYLDPSPIGKDISVEEWAKSNRTIRSSFRPSTNEIAVFVAGKRSKLEFGVDQEVSAKDTTVFLCQAQIPECRIPFITQMFGVFLNTTTMDPYKTPKEYRRHYEQYYEGIQQYQLQLCEQSKNEMETDDSVQTNQELELMDGFAAIWELAEYMFFTPDEKKPIAFMLSDWLAKHITGIDMQVGETLLGSTGKLSHPEFWSYINKCLLRGMKRSAVFMLEQALSDEETENIADALEGLLKIVRGIPSSEASVPDGKSRERHRKWQGQCEKFAKSTQLSHLGDAAESTVGILTGDIESILEATDSWLEAFSAIVLYTNPDCPRHELVPILNICVSRYLEGKEVSLLNKIEIAILELDAITTVRHCGNFHPWLVAHLADVFQQFGYLDMSDINLPDLTAMGWDSDIRDFFITSYAQSLMSDSNLWEAIAGYLLHCGHTGRSMLSEWICHVPLESSRKAQKVLKFCKDNNLTDSFRSINRVMAVEEEKRGQYALAIQHYMASKDYQRVAKVTDQMMQNYIQNGGLDLEDTLSAIPIFSVPNENVEFLRSYAKFHREFKDGKFTEAARTLVSLLSTDSAPMKYWAVLLFDALPLLENRQKVIFDSNDTYELMRCLEEVVGSQYKSEYLKLLPTRIMPIESSDAEREQQLGVIRLALVRNLARSIVHAPKSDTLMSM